MLTKAGKMNHPPDPPNKTTVQVQAKLTKILHIDSFSVAY